MFSHWPKPKMKIVASLLYHIFADWNIHSRG